MSDLRDDLNALNVPESWAIGPVPSRMWQPYEVIAEDNTCEHFTAEEGDEHMSQCVKEER